MSTSGGTLHGLPQTQRGHHTCSHCGLYFDSADSLQVHMHYHHDSVSRWGNPPSSTTSSTPTTGIPPTSTSSNISNSPTDSENNNQPPNSKLTMHISKSDSSPLHNTVSAAADSSDNQPPTPQPSIGGSGAEPGTPQSYTGATSPYQQHHQQPPPPPPHPNAPTELHYPSYMHSGYDQYYHTMDYGASQPHYLNSQLPQQEYKSVPSPRYHPYLSSSHTNGGSVPNSAMSPRVVSSSSPTQQHTLMQLPSAASSSVQLQVPPNQPTPSPSPKQCDKCGLVCDTVNQLSEHCATVHGAQPPSSDAPGSLMNRSGSSGEENEMQTYNQYQHYVKEEPTSDILDLDSQKMVYPPHDALPQLQIPPMHAMHSMQRAPMMWGHESHGFMPPHHQQEIKAPFYPVIKSEFGSTLPPSIKSEFGGSKTTDYMHHQTVLSVQQQQQQQQRAEVKPFGSEVSGNQLSSSPSEFPSTTTPQDNGTQFRSFEPATSSLPSSAAPVKSTSWKSNEARRPKTYNCTACNKWFTSSGHLKRHYNTTLHKNAVKSSGQPDPATLPISVHHHPSRDPNSKHHRNSAAQAAQQQALQQQQQQQQAQQQSEAQRSPEYTPQYTSPTSFAHQQQQQQQSQQQLPPPPSQGFQQYGTTLHTSAGGPPNGLAGPSVHASQPRGLLIYLTNNEETQMQPQPTEQAADQHNSLQDQQPPPSPQQHLDQERSQQPQQQQQQPLLPPPLQQELIHTTTQIPQSITSPATTINTINSMEHFNIINPITISTNTIPSYQAIPHQVGLQQSYHTIIGNSAGVDPLQQHNMSHLTYAPLTNIKIESDEYDASPHNNHQILQPLNTVPMMCRFTGGAAAYQGDTAPPFSPDVPEPYHMDTHPTSMMMMTARSPTPTQSAAMQTNTPPPPMQSAVTSPQQQASVTSPSSPMNVVSSTISNNEDSNASMPPQLPKSMPSKSTGMDCATQTTSSSTTNTTTSSANVLDVTTADHHCVQCNKIFNKACYLTQHNKTFHSGEKPYKCQRCGKRFSCDQAHEEHLTKHGGNKPFKCDLCPKQFNYKTDLRRHMCLHSGSKPYTCDLCGKGFIRKDHMAKHFESHRRKSEMLARKSEIAAMQNKLEAV